MRTFHDGVADLDALADTGLLKSEHFLHLRCEVPARDMLALFDPVADHRAGAHGQPDGSQPRRRPVRRSRLLPRAAPPRRARRGRHRAPHRRVAGAARTDARPEPPRAAGRVAGRNIAMASHDDRTEEEIARERRRRHPHQRIPCDHGSRAGGQGGRHEGDRGAPNIVRGGSHSGNVAAADLLRAGAVDAFASDYVPASLVEAAFHVRERGSALPEAVALVTDRPARHGGPARSRPARAGATRRSGAGAVA